MDPIKLDEGIHCIHLFYEVDRSLWTSLKRSVREQTRERLASILQRYPGPAHPRVMAYANVGGKADFAFLLMHEDLVGVGAMHREIEAAFPAGALHPVYTYLSVTELPEYVTTEDDMRRMIIGKEGLEPGSEDFDQRLQEMKDHFKKYNHYRLYPEMPDWEVMCFYPMNKKRDGSDNWYRLNFDTRKKLMAGHAKTGRKYAGRISQLITGSTGLDDWEWGVTLMAHQVDAVKEIVYEMRFDEVSARYGEFGEFYINARMTPEQLWEHLKL